ARAQPHRFPQFQVLGDRGKRGFAHQARSQSREITFRRLRVTPEHGLADHEIEQAVTEEFQPFVIAAAGTAVRECRLEQLAVFELVADTAAQPGNRIAQPPDLANWTLW